MSRQAKPNILDETHRAELEGSGLTDETIAASGIYSARDGEIKAVLGWSSKHSGWGLGWIVPYSFPWDEKAGYCRVKLDHPRHGTDDKPVKYESPRKAPNRPYFPPRFFETLDSADVLLITEGEKKALAAMQAGFPCISLPGVWTFQQKRLRTDTGRSFGERVLIPDLQRIKWTGRRVVIVFDSDAATNHLVRLAEAKLAEVLAKHGATVRVARLPQSGGDKAGLDDFLVAHGDTGPADLRKIIDAAQEPDTPDELNLMDWAAVFIDEYFVDTSGRTIQWYRDEYWRWGGYRYHILSESELRAIVLEWLNKRSSNATPHKASDVVKCIASIARVPFSLEHPCFIGTRRDIDPTNIIAFQNGLLDITDIGGQLTLIEHTPKWFSPTVLAYEFDPQAECTQWQTFLRGVLVENDLIELLQMWFGLCLTADTTYQKLLLMVGPKRSGKGTVLRTLQHVIGPDACASPMLGSLASEFGLWPMVGKTVAAFADAHLGYRTDSMRVLEVIKSIVGEDSVSINRKNLPYLPNVRLRVRFIITVNEMLRFSDPSGALSARLLVLPFAKSFAGREDRTLESRLKPEASGILNWALRGLFKLRSAGAFIIPAKSRDILRNYRRMTAPVVGFIEDCCIVEPGCEIGCRELYQAWCFWAQQNGHKAGADSTFGEHLRTAEPSVERKRPRTESHQRMWIYRGINLTDEARQAIRESSENAKL